MVRIHQTQDYNFSSQTVRQTDRVTDPSKTIDLTTINDRDSEQIESFLKAKGDDRNGWQIRVGSRTLEISSPEDAADYLRQLQDNIKQGDIANAEIGYQGDPFGATSVRSTYLRIEVLDPNNDGTQVGEHDQGMTDVGGDLILGNREGTFTNAADAEGFVEREGGAFVIVKNHDGEFDVYSLRSNNDTTLGSEADIHSSDFTSNSSFFEDNLAQLIGGTEAYISTSDNELMRLRQQTAIPIDSISDESITSVQVSARVEDIDGVDTQSRNDLRTDLSMTMTINPGQLSSRILNDPNLHAMFGEMIGMEIPEGTRFDITPSEDGLIISAQYGLEFNIILRPSADGTGLTVSALGAEVEFNAEGQVERDSTLLGDVGRSLVGGGPQVVGERLIEHFSNEYITYGKALAIENAAPYLERAGVHLPEELRSIDSNHLTPEDIAAIDQFLEDSQLSFSINESNELIINLDAYIESSSSADPRASEAVAEDESDFIEVDLHAEIDSEGIDAHATVHAELSIREDEAAGAMEQVNVLGFNGELTITHETLSRLEEQLSEPAREFLSEYIGQAVTIGDLRAAQEASIHQMPLYSLSSGRFIQPAPISDQDIAAIVAEAGKYNVSASGDIQVMAMAGLQSPVDDLSRSEIYGDALIDAQDVSITIPGNHEFRIEIPNLRTDISSQDNLNIFRQDEAILIQAGVEASITGTLYKNDETFVSLSDATLEGSGSLYIDEDGDMNHFLNGTITIPEGQYQNVRVNDLHVTGDGSVNYNESDGLDVQITEGSTARGRVNAGSNGSYAFDIQGGGDVQFDADGQLTSARVDGDYANIVGDINGTHFDLTADGNLELNRDPDTGIITITANEASIHNLQVGEYHLSDLDLSDTTLTYDPSTRELSLSTTAESLDFRGTLGGKELVIQSQQSPEESQAGQVNQVTLRAQVDDSSHGSFNLEMPQGIHLDRLQYGDYAMTDIHGGGFELSLHQQGEEASVGLRPSEEGVPFTASAQLEYGEGSYPVNVTASGELLLRQEATESGPAYSVSSGDEAIEISHLSIGTLHLDGASFQGSLIYTDQEDGAHVQFRGSEGLQLSGQVSIQQGGDIPFMLNAEQLDINGALNITPEGYIQLEEIDINTALSGNLNGIPIEAVGGVIGNADSGFNIGLHAGNDSLMVGGGAQNLSISRGNGGELVLRAAHMGLGAETAVQDIPQAREDLRQTADFVEAMELGSAGDKTVQAMVGVSKAMGWVESADQFVDGYLELQRAGLSGDLSEVTMTLTPGIDNHPPSMQIEAELLGTLGATAQQRNDPYQMSLSLLKDSSVSQSTRRLLREHILQGTIDSVGLPPEVAAQLEGERASSLLGEYPLTPEVQARFEDATERIVYEEGSDIQAMLRETLASQEGLSDEVRSLIEQAITDHQFESQQDIDDFNDDLQEQAEIHDQLLRVEDIQQRLPALAFNADNWTNSDSNLSNYSIGFESEAAFREYLGELDIPEEEIEELLSHPVAQSHSYQASLSLDGHISFDSTREEEELTVSGGHMSLATEEFEDVIATGIHERYRSRDTGSRVQGIGNWPIRFNQRRSGIEEDGQLRLQQASLIFGVPVTDLSVTIEDGKLAITPRDREGAGFLGLDNVRQRTTSRLAFAKGERLLGDNLTRSQWREERQKFIEANPELSGRDLREAMRAPMVLDADGHRVEGGLGGANFSEYRQSSGMLTLERGEDGQHTLLFDVAPILEEQFTKQAGSYGANMGLTLGDTEGLFVSGEGQDSVVIPYTLTIDVSGRAEEIVNSGAQFILDTDESAARKVQSGSSTVESSAESTFGVAEDASQAVDQAFELIDLIPTAERHIRQAQEHIQTGTDKAMGAQDQGEEVLDAVEDFRDEHL